MISRRAAEEGVVYRNNQNVLKADEAFQLVSENVGMAFLTMAGALRTKGPGVTVPLSSIRSFESSFIWHPERKIDRDLQVNSYERS
jgi:hypothetical protein